MGKYGKCAVEAARRLRSGKERSPIDAWQHATIKEFGAGTTAQKKGCPRDAFLGLCQEGLVVGVRPDRYTRSVKNKGYALTAVRILARRPDLATNALELWNEVIKPASKIHNQQMDVVVSLWRERLIVV